MELKWYPIHTHCMPDSLANVELVGSVFCVEMEPTLVHKYYGWSDHWPDTPIERIKTFLKSWNKLCAGQKTWLPYRPLFALESEADLGNLHELPELQSLGLASIQFLREKRDTAYFNMVHGVTDKGRALLDKMAELDILLDLSHLHGPLLEHVLSKAPGRRIVSHVVCLNAFPWSLARRANAMNSTELRACNAELYGIPFVDDLVSRKPCLTVAERKADIADVATHVVRLVEVVGKERVALGPDYFDYASLNPTGIEVGTVAGLEEREGLASLWQELCRRGLSDADVANIFWGNAKRLFPPAVEVTK
jgi:microsomal dipeptidase-like Zn-dependent dipeptidase